MNPFAAENTYMIHLREYQIAILYSLALIPTISAFKFSQINHAELLARVIWSNIIKFITSIFLCL